MKKLEICEVHRLLDGDTGLRMCEFCVFCSAWICESDLHSVRRIQAWAKRKNISLENLRKYLGI